MQKLLPLLGIGVLLLSGCTQEQAPATETQKQDFIVKTKPASTYGGDAHIQKTGRIQGAQNITVSAQASGKITYIPVKEGEYLKKGWLVMQMQDTVSNYGLNVQRSRVALDSAKISYEDSLIKLDKAISDAQIDLERKQHSYNTAKQDMEEELAKASSDVSSSSLDQVDSTARLNLESAQKAYDKAKLDYENKLKADQQTLSSNNQTIENEYKKMSILLDNIINFADPILGVSLDKQNLNDSYEKLLGAKDSASKIDAQNQLRSLIKTKQKIDNERTNDVSADNIITKMDILDTTFDEVKEFLDSMDYVLRQSLASTELPQTTLDTWLSTNNGYRTSYQTNNSTFIATQNSITSFMNTYQDQQTSLQKNLEIQEQNLEIQKQNLQKAESDTKTRFNRTLLAAQERLKNAELALKTAEQNLENAIKNKDVMLKSLDNSIANAQISYSESLKNNAKLSVNSPIDGQVSKILVDNGQEVGVGTPLFEIVSNQDQEIKVGLTSQELKLVQPYQEVLLRYDDETLTGTITSIAEVADANLNYPITIVVNTPVKMLGDFVKVNIPVNTNQTLLPINIVSPVTEKVGYIYYLTGSAPDYIIEQTNLNLGKIWGDKIQITDGLNDDMQVITSDVSNYDKERYKIVVQPDGVVGDENSAGSENSSDDENSFGNESTGGEKSTTNNESAGGNKSDTNEENLNGNK